MVCFHPVYVANVGEVGCGKCRACRIMKTREWTVRLLHEYSSWEKGTFVTLTYSPENLPGGLVKRDLQLFFKRLRRDLEPAKIKYFACGEYGEKYNRPHYHAIIFGVGPKDPIIKDNWEHGFVASGTLTAESCAYVSGYIQKKLGGLAGKLAYGDREPPFSLMSKGLGLKWMEENEKYLVSKVGLTLKGKEVSLPRYYRKKLGDKLSEDRLINLAAGRMAEEHEKLEAMGIDVSDPVKRREHKKALFEQKASESDYKAAQYRRRKF